MYFYYLYFRMYVDWATDDPNRQRTNNNKIIKFDSDI